MNPNQDSNKILKSASVSTRLRCPDRDQMLLCPQDVEDLIEMAHPARAVWAYVEGLSLPSLYESIQSVEGVPGHPATDPKLLLALGLYATLDGVGFAGGAILHYNGLRMGRD